MAVGTERALAAEEALGQALIDYTGQWVAIRDHRVVDQAATLDALLERVEPKDIDRVLDVRGGSGRLLPYWEAVA